MQQTNSLARASRSSANHRPVIMAGILVIILTVVGFFAWAALTPLARGAHVLGKVAVETRTKTVQHLEGGIVKEIRVREGDVVKKGDVLIVLEPVQAQVMRETFLSRQILETILEARLQAEHNEAGSFALPAGLAARRADPRVKASMADQLAVFEARRREFSSAQATNREQYRLLKGQLERLGDLQAKDFYPLNRYQELQREAEKLQGEYTSREAASRKQVLEELRDVRGRLREIREQMISAEDILTRTVIRAPQDGQVVGLVVATVGGVINRGEVIMRIVPDDEPVYVEAQVKPLDVDVIHPGLPAEVRFSALPRRTSPLLRGKVLTISTDTLFDRETNQSYYLARIEVDKAELAKLGKVTVIPGMPVEVLISAGERTVLEYLVDPWMALFERAMRED